MTLNFDIANEQVDRVLEIVKKCPDNLREKCFEILLSAALLTSSASSGSMSVTPESNGDASAAERITSGTDIVMADLHQKAKKHVPAQLTLEEVNRLFYKEDGIFLPLYDELKSQKLSEAQIRVALMEALKNGIQSGEFSFKVSRVRELCSTYKCLDSGNFSANFKNNQPYFSDPYSSGGTMALSAEGKNRMIAVAKELAQ